jgi:hypothetical protein
MNEILKLKADLYTALLVKEEGEGKDLSHSDIHIKYVLEDDKDLQDYLEMCK